MRPGQSVFTRVSSGSSVVYPLDATVSPSHLTEEITKKRRCRAMLRSIAWYKLTDVSEELNEGGESQTCRRAYELRLEDLRMVQVKLHIFLTSVVAGQQEVSFIFRSLHTKYFYV